MWFRYQGAESRARKPALVTSSISFMYLTGISSRHTWMTVSG